MSHPDDLTVEIGTETLSATADVLSERERSQVYAVQAGRYAGFAEYRAKTTRPIPVVALTLHRGTGA